MPSWLFDCAAVAARVAAKPKETAAVSRVVGSVLSTVAFLLDSGPMMAAARAQSGADEARVLLGSLVPMFLRMPERYEFLETAVFYGGPTSAPCADLLGRCASALAYVLDHSADYDDVADPLLNTATALDGYVLAAHNDARIAGIVGVTADVRRVGRGRAPAMRGPSPHMDRTDLGAAAP